MAVSDSLSISPSVFGAGLAADDLILTLYFTAIYALAKNIPPDAATPLPPENTTNNTTTSRIRTEPSTPELKGVTDNGSHDRSTEDLEAAGSSPLEASTSGRPPSQAAIRVAGVGQQGGEGGHHSGAPARPIYVLEGLSSLAVSVVICHAAHCLSRAMGAPGQV